jgi:signal transduction histidine kinase
MSTSLPLLERLRPRSIRAKVVVLLTLPVVSLMALWGYAAVSTASQVSATKQLQEVSSTLTTPIRDFTTAVQDERTAALVYRAAPNSDDKRALDSAEQRTDRAATALRAGVDSSSTDTASLSSALPGRINSLLGSASSLTTGRAAGADLNLAHGYDDAVQQAFAVQAGLSDADSAANAGGTRAVLEIARAREALSTQDGILRAARASGTLTQSQYLSFVQQTAVQHSLTDAGLPDLRARDASAYRAVLGSPAAGTLSRAQQSVAEAGAGRTTAAVPAAEWDPAAGRTLDGLAKAEAGADSRVAGTDPYSFSVLGGSGVAVVLGLIGVIVSLLLSVRIGRGLVTDLVGLRNTALRLASDRLPAAIRRIHNGERLDVDAEAPQAADGGGRSEVGQVAAALSTVHRAALRAVAGRAAALTGVSGVYVGLARRSQVLLHKQLDLLDSMERRTEDPVELEDLFRLDHLTTRMRRHAESLLILSGTAPGRGWRNPVPLLDAVRAGTAETADLTRIRIEDVPEVWLDGAAVADLVHLVAELTENATAFSPPHTQVVVRGDEVGSGAVLEIEDRGLGMSEAALKTANERISAPEVDLLDSRQLGLFVVNRLAQRLGLQVTLRHSPYGGVCAVIYIPKERLGALHPGLRSGADAPRGATAVTANAPAPGRDGGAPDPTLPRYARRADAVRPTGAAAQTARPARPAPPAAPADAQPVVPNEQFTPPAAPAGAQASAPEAQFGPPPEGAPEPLPARGPRHRRQPAAEAPPAAGQGAGAAPGPDDDGLPRRVRQASLAPELRRSGQEAQQQSERPPRAPAHRSPEAARATISSLRSGRRRARTGGAEPGSAGGAYRRNQTDDANEAGEAGDR